MPMDIDLHENLKALAEQVRPSPDPERAVMTRVRRTRRRRRMTVSAAAVAVGVALVASLTQAVAAQQQFAAPAPDGPFLGWQVAGDAADTALVQQAQRTWDVTAGAAASVGPHREVRPLLVTRDRALGAVVVLQAYDATGNPRLAFFTADKGVAAQELALRADRPLVDPVDTRAVSLVSPRLQGAVGTVSSDHWGTYAIVVASPGVDGLRVSSTTIDQELTQGGAARNGRFLITELPISSTALTTTVRGYVGSRTLFTAPADGGAVGDAQAVPVAVIATTAGAVTVTGDVAQVRRGQYAAVAQGIVGEVTAVDQTTRTATITLITSTAFSAPAYSNIDIKRGHIQGDGATLLMTGVSPNDVLVGNRIMVADPAQKHDQAGALTIGRVTAAADSSSVTVTPGADLAHLQTVYIMVPSAG